ncbi:response regulator transcription factor [Psychrosphaera sp. 1_MG-2023]|uniref:response regulator transcription factor n=1 Tax=unclassified Psychrosphaera TaxID=2641570 RepID=UPI00209139DE|nr:MULTISPECIES: response regulator transcription factor [unclassified Psychrosphaera]MDO6720936.1 response regulator transcription factor [Psychrosphaera sp. 1_MG-2023]
MLANPITVLVVEDNISLAEQLIAFLENLSWTVDFAAKGKMAIDLLNDNIYDVVILDLSLPDIDGTQVCQHIKTNNIRNTPVLMLTARDSFEDLETGFDTGADDYLTKPYDLREVAMRCKALARRHELHESNAIQLGNMELSQRDKTVRINNNEIPLTKVGFQILQKLIKSYPNAITRSELIFDIWADEPPETNALKVHVYSLRQQLKPYPNLKISTLSGVGYRLEMTDV